jgi:hypothetical protein
MKKKRLSASALLASLAIVMAVLAAACGPAAPTALPTAVPTALPMATPTPGELSFEVVALGAPFVGRADAVPVIWAVRGDNPGRAAPPGLPDEAAAALSKSMATADPALYVLVYLGRQPSSGYGLRIVSMAQRAEAGVQKLVVTYALDKPDPNKGAATVITHPFVIARVAGTKIGTANVVFQQQ